MTRLSMFAIPMLALTMLALTTSVALARDCYGKRVTARDMPAYIPASDRDDFVVMWNSALEYADVLDAPYSIDGVRVSSETLFVTISRCSLKGEIKIGKIAGLRGATIKDNSVYLQIMEPSPGVSKWWWGLGGFASGVVSALVLVLVIAL